MENIICQWCNFSQQSLVRQSMAPEIATYYYYKTTTTSLLHHLLFNNLSVSSTVVTKTFFCFHHQKLLMCLFIEQLKRLFFFHFVIHSIKSVIPYLFVWSVSTCFWCYEHPFLYKNHYTIQTIIYLISFLLKVTFTF